MIVAVPLPLVLRHFISLALLLANTGLTLSIAFIVCCTALLTLASFDDAGSCTLTDSCIVFVPALLRCRRSPLIFFRLPIAALFSAFPPEPADAEQAVLALHYACSLQLVR